MKSNEVFSINGLLIKPSSNTTIQAIRATFIGGVAFISDAGTLWALSLTGLNYLICAVFSFIVGVTVNYVLSSRFVFAERASVGRYGEIAVYVVVSLIGLGLTEALLWFFTAEIGWYFMISKGVASLIAFAWNFTARKLVLYRGK